LLLTLPYRKLIPSVSSPEQGLVSPWASEIAVGSARRDKKCINILVENPEGKRPLGRPRHK
jgi:hypothetical protein